MRQFNTTFAFIDFLFILLAGFVSLFLIALLLINPIAKEGVIDPKTQMMILTEWNPKSVVDIDIWVKGPDGTIVSYQRKDGKYIVLERDDLGIANDVAIIDGKIEIIERNLETVMINKLIDGEYVVNLHNYSGFEKKSQIEKNQEAYPTPIKIKFLQIDPFKVIYEKELALEFRAEKTILTFEVIDGKIYDKRTDVDIPLYTPFGSGVMR